MPFRFVDPSAPFCVFGEVVGVDALRGEDGEVGGVGVKARAVLADIGIGAGAFRGCPQAATTGRGEARHVVFGYGRHHCIGSVLAQSNLEIMLRVLFERLPDHRVDWARAVRKQSVSLHAFDTLPITW